MSSPSLDARITQALKWRCIGPPRGGRVVAVAGHPTDPMTAYFGAVAGGVWKTTDGGAYWKNISDGYFNTASIGALAVSEADPNVIYAGAGESTIRIDVSYGDGVYKSTDAGKTWKNIGLKDTRHIGEIRIHPRNPDLVYVAALGHAFGPNRERGVFRSRDGGRSWEKVLFKSDSAGAVDLSLDTNNPRILFASVWQTHRHFWELSSGGPDSGLHRSVDGGDTWTDISSHAGLPTGLKGKIGVAVSPAKSGRVWAIIEAEKGGLFRSDDGGDTWELLTDNRDLMNRPWYYMHIFADPKDPDTVYVNNLDMLKSTDGGKTFTQIATPHGDNHDLWIDPTNPKHLVQGNDGGACVTYNGGETWSTIYNQMTAQFYRMDTDTRFPYHVYATQQDNSSIAVPSATEKGAIAWQDCFPAGTGESGDIAVHPQDPDIVYVGAIGSSPGGGASLQRYDHRTRQVRLITVWPESNSGLGGKDAKYRFAWTFPITFSPHDPGILYAAGNVVFRTRDEGATWEPVSPDLSQQDVSKMEPSGGPITKDCSGAEMYATVYAFLESPHTPGELWAGTDDGLVHISRDHGKTWTNVTPPGLPEWTMIAMIDASPHAPGTVYVAATRYKLDDCNAYIYKTEDYGRTWRTLSDGFPEGQISRSIREDPVQPGLLYAGTETGLVVSLDDGASWQRLETNLPVAPVYDLAVKDGDLIVATHGRSFWILDDVTPLREAAKAAIKAPAVLCPPRPTYRRWINFTEKWYREPGRHYAVAIGSNATYDQETTPDGEIIRRFLDAGENPPPGVIMYYHLEASENVTLSILESDGTVIRTFTPKPAESTGKDDTPKKTKKERYIPVKPGLNRFIWDMRYPDATPVEEDADPAYNGPLAVPGVYQVRLSVGDTILTQSFEILKDPRVSAGQEVFEAQFALWRRICDRVSETHTAIRQVRKLKKQTGDWSQRATERDSDTSKAVVNAAKALEEKLTAVEKALIQTEGKGGLRLPVRLSEKLTELISDVSSADAAPTKQIYDVFEHLSAQIADQLAILDEIIEKDVAAFNALVRDAGMEAVG